MVRLVRLLLGLLVVILASSTLTESVSWTVGMRYGVQHVRGMVVPSLGLVEIRTSNIKTTTNPTHRTCSSSTPLQ